MKELIGTAPAGQTEPGGVLILDKPEGMTSHDCVAAVRKRYRTKRVGHTGTLDPLATGVLPILIGPATKAAEYLSAENKKYEAVLKLGLTTDTEDISGKVLSESTEIPDADRVFSALDSFRGDILQTPPMYSAIKINGEKLYDLARQGITVDREARPVTVYDLRAEQISRAEYRLSVHCSKGTYIRTLCADIGAKLGCGGVMASLRRTASGGFTLEQARLLSELEGADDGTLRSYLLPTESLFSADPVLTLDGFFLHLAENGQPVRLYKLGKHTEASFANVRYVRLTDPSGVFFALGEVCLLPDENQVERLSVKPVKRFAEPKKQ